MPAQHPAKELLEPLAEADANTYYNTLTTTFPGVEIRLHAAGKGKGIYTTQDVAAGQQLFHEEPLAASQHYASKESALLCGHCFAPLGSIEVQVAWMLQHKRSELTGEVATDPAFLQRLQEGRRKLPLSERMPPLPEPVACQGGCIEELYCTSACAETAWERQHSLLCVGPTGRAAADSSRLEALQAFTSHAVETNDIFILAATVIAQTLLRAESILQTQQGQTEEKRQRLALRAAWRPYAAGWKAAWWKSVAMPEDVEDEAAFRAELLELATDSLELLKPALYDPRFSALFDLQVYGNIVGMFELNNLDLVVQNPVDKWMEVLFAHHKEKEDEIGTAEDFALAMELGPVVDNLEEICSADTSTGTAFYALQSCMNHSCLPTAEVVKDDSLSAHSVVLQATGDLSAGEELTISYIDESLSYEERREALRDYGFVCHCEKCVADAAELGGGEQGEMASPTADGRRQKRKAEAL